MGDIAQDIRDEHARLADTLETVGPDAPSGLAGWTAADLAAHVHSQTAAGGSSVFVGRWLIARGVHLSAAGAQAARPAIWLYRRQGFDRSIAAIRDAPPALLTRPSVAGVGLFEVWMHHDDLLRANGRGEHPEPPTLGLALDFARRYQEKALRGLVPDGAASVGEQLRWLSGRPSALPPPPDALRF